MSEFYTESYFSGVSARMSFIDRLGYDNPSVSSNTHFDVFLSYNIKDMQVVKGIYYYLRKMGVSVYLDVIVDPDLRRSETNKAAAACIQNRLKHSTSLIYAQSASAESSNWMPWELGVVDGNTGKCMILPVTTDARRVSPKREYLLLYPYIKLSTLYNEMRVFEDEGNSHSLQEFLKA